MTRRMLVVLLVLAVSVGYYALRARPAGVRVGRMRVASESARIQMEGLAAAPAARPGAGAEQQRDEQRGTLERHSADVSVRMSAFASCGEPEQLDELRLRISRLADDCGLLIRSNLGCTEAERRAFAQADDTPHARYVAALLDRSTVSPALRRITFESSFPGLRRFLEELPSLPGRVVIVGFEIHAQRAQAVPSLRTELVLAY